ncbi:DUF1516 family protein [Bacillaceae bacterium W0354]
MTHMHITTWVIAIILFVVVLSLMKKEDKAKAAKITHMVLRVFYLLILLSGLDLFFRHYFGLTGNLLAESIIKSVAGVWVIAAMEIVLAKVKKDKSAFSGWLQLVLALILVLALGFGRLPLGILP